MYIYNFVGGRGCFCFCFSAALVVITMSNYLAYARGKIMKGLVCCLPEAQVKSSATMEFEMLHT